MRAIDVDDERHERSACATIMRYSFSPAMILPSPLTNTGLFQELPLISFHLIFDQSSRLTRAIIASTGARLKATESAYATT